MKSYIDECHRIQVNWMTPNGAAYQMNMLVSPDEFERLVASRQDTAAAVYEKREARIRWCKMMGERFSYMFAGHFDKLK